MKSTLRKEQVENYLPRSRALISVGFFLFSSANTTVTSRPRRIWPSIWYLASAASAGSTYWTKPNPRGSLKKQNNKKRTKEDISLVLDIEGHVLHRRTISWVLDKSFAYHKPFTSKFAEIFPNNMDGHDKRASTRLLTFASVSFKITWNSSRLGTSSHCIQTQLPSNLHYH